MQIKLEYGTIKPSILFRKRNKLAPKINGPLFRQIINHLRNIGIKEK